MKLLLASRQKFLLSPLSRRENRNRSERCQALFYFAYLNICSSLSSHVLFPQTNYEFLTFLYFIYLFILTVCFDRHISNSCITIMYTLCHSSPNHHPECKSYP